MRMRHPDGTIVHLGYCTNVHQAEDLAGLIEQLDRFARPVREHLGANSLSVGLWLAAGVARELAADTTQVQQLRDRLTSRGLEVVTLNGFPYANFHAPVVKRAVYEPSWLNGERTRYTLDLAHILAELLPDDAVRGSVSTLPLGWRTPWSSDRDDIARRQLDWLVASLGTIADRAGRQIQVGFEPEPGCVIEQTDQAVRFLHGLDPELVGVCLDTCHLAVQFEDAQTAVQRLTRAGVRVMKAQLACALRAECPADAATTAALREFVEPRFLHQTRTRVGVGQIDGVDDLDRALDGGLSTAREWRVHYHVPIHATPHHPLGNTQDDLIDALRVLMGGAAPVTDHLEVETYTWSVLPEADRPMDDAGLIEGIAKELRWAREQLTGLGLTEVAA